MACWAEFHRGAPNTKGVGGDIDGELAEDARLTLRDLRLTRHPLTDEMADPVWQLRHNAPAHDASYVALAEHLDVPVVTVDGRLARGLQGSKLSQDRNFAVGIDPPEKPSVALPPSHRQLGYWPG